MPYAGDLMDQPAYVYQAIRAAETALSEVNMQERKRVDAEQQRQLEAVKQRAKVIHGR